MLNSVYDCCDPYCMLVKDDCSWLMGDSGLISAPYKVAIGVPGIVDRVNRAGRVHAMRNAFKSKLVFGVHLYLPYLLSVFNQLILRNLN